MGNLKLPKQVGGVLLAIENDTKPEALKGRERAIRHYQDQGLAVELLRPPAGNDLNDTLLGKREKAG